MAGRPVKGDYKLDTKFNLRVNNEIKEAFKQLCEDKGMTSGTIINEYMQKCVEEQEIIR